MMNQANKRAIRHRRVRASISGTLARPRLSVFRSSRFLQLQVIDDDSNKTILGFTDRGVKGKTKTERARALGKDAAGKIVSAGFKKAVFDRGGYRYQGRVRALAESLREGGLEF